MLRDDVVEACRAGVLDLSGRDIDEGIALLTGVQAGAGGLSRQFPR